MLKKLLKFLQNLYYISSFNIETHIKSLKTLKTKALNKNYGNNN